MLHRFRKEIAPIELYGKLPIAKDYLRVGGGTGAGIALRDWLDQGFSSRAERGAAPTLAWAGRFLLGGYSGDPIMGCSWPSSDSGGLRPFPFAVFTARRRRTAASEWAAGGAGLRPIWDDLRGAYTAHRSYADGSAYLDAMRGTEIDMARNADAPPQQVDFDAWVTALWPDEGVDGLVHVLTELARLAARGHRGPVRLPLVSDLPSTSQAHAWWSAMCDLGLTVRGELPTVFFPQVEEDAAGDASAYACFFLAPLDPAHQVWIGPRRDPLGAGDLALPEPRFAGAAPPSEATPPLFESLRGPLASARAHAG
ncbi:MAG: TagF domain-containing protein [Planctomycetota bacterium]